MVIALLSGCGPSARAEPPLRVGIVGDQTSAENLDAAYAVLERGVRRLAAERPALVLHTGDLVESAAEPARYRAAFARATALLDGLGAPWYLAAGDHDVNPPAFVPGSPDRSCEALFRELYGARRPEARDRLYYSFDAAGYHFIALYSQEALHADPRWGAVLLAGLTPAQVEWLAADLERHRDARGIAVFLHQPLWYTWTRWAEVHALLRRYPVAAVVSGHFHYNQDGGALDGIRYVTVGAAGGRTKRGSRSAGDLQYVTLLTLRGREAAFDVLPVDTAERLPLTTRDDMDRVQMIDQMLGALWRFGDDHTVRSRGGALVGSCDGGAPATLALPALGNPLDVPLRLTVRPSGPHLAEARFAPAACRATDGGTWCEMAPGAGIAIANLSSVETTWGCEDGCRRPPAIWMGSAEVAPGAPLPESVSLTVRAAFTGRSGELHLERVASAPVAPCP